MEERALEDCEVSVVDLSHYHSYKYLFVPPPSPALLGCLVTSNRPRVVLTSRSMRPEHYQYLLNLPLTLHIPSLHTFVVHAGMLPYDPTKSLQDATQPLEAASKSHFAEIHSGRLAQELGILLGVRQNTDPYTLIEMRSVYTHGKKKGKVTKNAKKGKPWSQVWNQQMKRCRKMESLELEQSDERRSVARRDDDDDDEVGGDLQCSPVNIIYGHAGEFSVPIEDVVDISWSWP